MIARYSLSRSLMKCLRIVERVSLQNIFLQKEEWTFLCRITNQKHKNNNTFTHYIHHMELNRSRNRGNLYRRLQPSQDNQCILQPRNQGSRFTLPSRGSQRCFLPLSQGKRWCKHLLLLSRGNQCWHLLQRKKSCR